MSVVARASAPEPQAAQPASRRDLRRWHSVLLVQTLLAACVCFFSIGRKSLWMDEGFSYFAANRPLDSLASLIVRDETNMGAFYVVLHFWQKLGDGEAFLRSLAAICAVATVPLLATFVDRVFGRSQAVAAGFLMALSPMSVIYAQELRGYSMAMLAATASMLLFLNLVGSTPERRTVWGYVAISAFGIYVHYFVVLVIAVQLSALLWHPSRSEMLRRVRVPVAVLGALAAPVVCAVALGDNDQVGWIKPTSWNSVYGLGQWFSGDFTRWKPGLVVAGICVLLATSVGRRDWRTSIVDEAAWRRTLTWAWLLLPPVATAIVSIHQPLWVDRYLIVSLPPWIALVAVGAWSISWPTMRAIVAGVLVVGSANSLINYYAVTTRWSADWRAATEHLVANGGPGAATLFAPSSGRNLVDYYTRSAEPATRISDVLIADGDSGYGLMHARNADSAAVKQRLAAIDRTLWMIADGRPDDAVSACVTAAGFVAQSTRSFGSVTVTAMKRGSATMAPVATHNDDLCAIY